jgi:hypothetical protein
MVLAACSEMLTDEQGNASLISVFSALDVVFPENTEITSRALAPKPWKVVTIWNVEESELGKEYIHRLEIFTPDGEEFGNDSTLFITKTRSHNIRLSIPGLPIGVEGNIVLKAWLELLGLRSTPVHTYEISIRHRKP